tara:strand:+ start:62 stop:598 length:537 start_codon:yes stop_codon:yes gene_type:complete
MSFFNRFPLFAYDVKNNSNYKILPDILRRVKLRSSIRGASMMFDTYDVKEGERPEDVAFKWFGDAELHWVILMTNNVTDRYYDWPMNQAQFQEFIEDKYSNPDAIHHYEITKSSGRTTGEGPADYSHLVEVNSDTDNATSISNRQFEEREQDKKRNIRLLDKRYLNDFIDEFNSLIQE